MDQKAHVNSLLEDGWFFGNSLVNKPRSTSKMQRCYSDPCRCSSTKEDIRVSPQGPPNASIRNLLRTPSLPPFWGVDMQHSPNEEGDEEEDEPRMGDLIRQAMPLPMPSDRRLDRTPSLPPCRGKEGSIGVPSIQNGPNGIGRLTRRASIDSSVLLQEKGSNGLPKLSRRASIESTVLPPKYSSKATKQSSSNSKNRPQRKLDLPNINGSTKEDTRRQNPNCNFKDLGFSFDNKLGNPTVVQVLPALQRQRSLGSSFNDNNDKVRRPYLFEAWHHQSYSSPSSAPPIIEPGDLNAPSTEDVKALIKFWARAVASNVRQEC